MSLVDPGPAVGPRGFALRPIAALVLTLTLAAAAPAADRPYLATATAAAEEDDDDVWSVESTFVRLPSSRAFVVAPEYAFNPTTSLQLEIARVGVRPGGDTSLLAEVELKHLFNHIARDGWGVGAVVALGHAKPRGESFRRDDASLALPFSLALWDGAGLLHANLGVVKERGERREWSRALALEREVWKRTTLFTEVARLGEARLGHVGVRHWLRRERFAVDLGWQRRRPGDTPRESGVVIGLNWYDL